MVKIHFNSGDWIEIPNHIWKKIQEKILTTGSHSMQIIQLDKGMIAINLMAITYVENIE